MLAACRFVGVAGFAACLCACSPDTPPKPVDQIGDTYEIRLNQSTTSSSGGGSGSSTSNMMLVEAVIVVREDGVELEFDLPPGTSEEDRSRDWQFPVRVFNPDEGELELLNEAELETRIADWLERGGIDRSACGQWIFTWTAIKIECDPRSVLDTIRPFDLRPGKLEAGAPYQIIGGRESAPLELEKSGPEGRIFTARFDIDPEVVRRERAQADVAVAQMLGEPDLSIDDALRTRPAESIEGSMTVTIHVDPDGRVTRHVSKVVLDVDEPDGYTSHEEVTETITRKRLTAMGGEE